MYRKEQCVVKLEQCSRANDEAIETVSTLQRICI